MQGAGITRPSGPIVQLDLPPISTLAANNVVVEVRAAGVGNWDAIMRDGGWSSGLSLPHAIGVEAAGVIVAIGSAVDSSMLGMEVLTYSFPFQGGGAWAEQFVAVARDVVQKPTSMAWAQAAVISVPALTAAQALSAVDLQPGERLFVHGAGGVTGSLIVQLALVAGAQVVASAGPSSGPRLADFGARIVDRTRGDWVSQVSEALDGPPDAAVNAVPGDATRLLGLVSDSRRLASISGPSPGGGAEVFVQSDGVRLAELVELFENGRLVAPTVQTFDLQHADAAIELARKGAHGEAVALLMPGRQAAHRS